MIRFSPPFRVAVLAAVFSAPAHAVVLAGWTFETNTPTLTTGATSGPAVSAETGTRPGTLGGVHTTAATWNSAEGNGSEHAYAADSWTTGDYFQFSSSSTDHENITVSLDQIGASGSPRDFQFSYSIDGTNFVNFGVPYLVERNAPTNILWDNQVATDLTTYTFDLSGISALDDAAAIYFRISQVGTTSVNGTTVTASGFSRIDNVVINGTAIVPEPATALLGIAGLLGFLRRRR